MNLTHPVKTMSSLEIAELTGKNHADVLRDIRNIFSEVGIDESKFAGIYSDSRLRDEGYLMANNQPYQRFVDNDLFVVVEGVPFTDSNGKSHPTFTTRITGKGQVFFEKKFRGTEAKPALALVV